MTSPAGWSGDDLGMTRRLATLGGTSRRGETSKRTLASAPYLPLISGVLVRLPATVSIDNISMSDTVWRVKPSHPRPLSHAAIHILIALGPEERHGYAIMSEVERMTGGTTRIGPGTLYTTIKRMLADGLIEESDERPDQLLDDQRRRYYRLTAAGKAVAALEVRRLESLVASARPWALDPDR
jgi:DNA-binding PadR family transcriptional regulator